MKSLIINNQQRSIDMIHFRNMALAENSKTAYNNAVKGYYKYLQTNSLQEGFDSVKLWLRSIDNSNTYNQRLQAIKDYLLKHFENESPEIRIELNDFFKSMKRIKPDNKIKEIDYLTKKQVEKFASNTTDTISCIVLALFWTGCRISELINIKLSYCKVNKSVSIKIRGKGGKDREVYIPVEIYQNIIKIFAGKKYLFENKHGKPYSRVYLTRKIKEEAQRVLSKNISAHSLRHSKAMYLKKERELTPDQIAKALGHSSVVTTLEFYFHGTPTAEEQGIV